VAESPGVGGPKWNEAIAAAKEKVCDREKGNVAARKEALGRIDDELSAWLLVSQFEGNEEASGTVLSECCARVARWAAARAGVTGATSEERNQFLILAALGSELAELLQQTPKVTRSQLERLLHQISDGGWPSGPAAELGHVHRVLNPAALREAANMVVWWDFSEQALPSRHPWTQQEMEQLKGHGVSLLTPELAAARENELGLRPLLAARQQLVLVVPRQRGGNMVARHPLHARLLSLLEGKNPSLPTIDLDAEVSTGKASAPLELRRIAHIPRRSCCLRMPGRSRWQSHGTAGRARRDHSPLSLDALWGSSNLDRPRVMSVESASGSGALARAGLHWSLPWLSRQSQERSGRAWLWSKWPAGS